MNVADDNSVPERILRLTQHFPGLWHELRGARLFVTGGTGFVGVWLLETLALADTRHALDLRIDVLTRDVKAAAARLPALAARPEVRFVAGDVRDFAFPDGDYSHIMHLAAVTARATFDDADPLEQFDIAYQGTRRVLTFAAHCGACRLLMTSSGSVYSGAAEYGMAPISESYLGAPQTDDLLSAPEHGKRAAEFLVAYHRRQYGLATAVARCFSFLGPGLPFDIHYAVGNFIRDALWGKAVVVNGDGSPVRSYLDVGDWVVWLLVMLTRAPGGSVYNVGSDVAISILELATRVRDLLAPDKPIVVLAANTGKVNRNIYVPNISRAREDLQLDIWTPLDESIRSTAEFAIAARGH